MQLSKLSFFVLILSFPLMVGAAGGGDGGGGGGPTKSAYMEKSSKLNALTDRIREKKKGIQDLIRQKNATKNPEAQGVLIKQMLTDHDELKKMVKEYNTLRIEVVYRFPDKGESLERNYLPMREQSLDQIEEELGLDADLSRLKTRVDKKYRSFFTEDEQQAKRVIQEKKKKKKDEKATKRLQLVK